MSLDIALGKESHDIFFENGDLPLVKDVDAVEQQLSIRLQTFLGEWFLDTSIGLPFFEEILIKNPNVPSIESIIKTQIIDTKDVQELVSFGTNFDQRNREFSVEFEVITVFGPLQFNETIFKD